MTTTVSAEIGATVPCDPEILYYFAAKLPSGQGTGGVRRGQVRGRSVERRTGYYIVERTASASGQEWQTNSSIAVRTNPVRETLNLTGPVETRFLLRHSVAPNSIGAG